MTTTPERKLAFDPITAARRQWEDRWGDGPASAVEAVMTLMRAQQILMARLNALVAPFDLTFPRYEALMLLHLSRSGSLPLGKLGERLQVHPTSVTSIVDALERSGHVRREPHATDRRMTLATLTPSGREAATACTDVLNEARFGTLPLDTADLEAVADLLRPLRAEAGDVVEPLHPSVLHSNSTEGAS